MLSHTNPSLGLSPSEPCPDSHLCGLTVLPLVFLSPCISQAGRRALRLSGAVVAPECAFGHIQPTEELSAERSYGSPVQRGSKQYRTQLEALGCPAILGPTKGLQSYCHRRASSCTKYRLLAVALNPLPLAEGTKGEGREVLQEPPLSQYLFA